MFKQLNMYSKKQRVKKTESKLGGKGGKGGKRLNAYAQRSRVYGLPWRVYPMKGYTP